MGRTVIFTAKILILSGMKRKYYLLLLLFATACVFLCAFTFDKDSSLKDLTHPYINTYECTAARLGNEDLLEQYEYFRITLLDEKELEVSFKRKRFGKKHIYRCNYTFNPKTRELSAELGILGYRFKQTTKISNGKFTISMPVFGKPLLMNFAVK